MAQAQMRMPRHGYRPDGSKPYGPHGPMAPPPHMKVNIFFQNNFKLRRGPLSLSPIFMQISNKINLFYLKTLIFKNKRILFIPSYWLYCFIFII